MPGVICACSQVQARDGDSCDAAEHAWGADPPPPADSALAPPGSVFFLFKSVNEMVRFNDLLVKQVGVKGGRGTSVAHVGADTCHLDTWFQPGLSVEKVRTLEQWQRDWAKGSVRGRGVPHRWSSAGMPGVQF